MKIIMILLLLFAGVGLQVAFPQINMKIEKVIKERSVDVLKNNNTVH